MTRRFKASLIELHPLIMPPVYAVLLREALMTDWSGLAGGGTTCVDLVGCIVHGGVRCVCGGGGGGADGAPALSPATLSLCF